jgi:predicted lipid-binding transport protein (Tim44 family)
VKVALAACLAALLCGCASLPKTSGDAASYVQVAQTAIHATQQIVAQDAAAGLITTDQAKKANGYLMAAAEALAAAQAAWKAGDATTEQERLDAVTEALVQANAAIIDVVARR